MADTNYGYDSTREAMPPADPQIAASIAHVRRDSEGTWIEVQGWSGKRAMLHVESISQSPVVLAAFMDWADDAFKGLVPWTARHPDEAVKRIAGLISGFGFRELQQRQGAWVRHNFPKQVCEVSAADVRLLCNGKPKADVVSIHDVARAVNSGALSRPRHHALLGAAEEIGELCHAHLKAEQGIRGTPAEHQAAKVDAVADCVIFLASYCNTHGIDMEAAVRDTWARVEKRNWVENPANADAVAEQAEPGKGEPGGVSTLGCHPGGASPSSQVPLE